MASAPSNALSAGTGPDDPGTAPEIPATPRPAAGPASARSAGGPGSAAGSPAASVASAVSPSTGQPAESPAGPADPADPPHPADAPGPKNSTGTADRAAGSGAALVAPSVLADAGELLRALAAPVRIAIVLQLREADRCVHELVDALDVAQPLISQHLRVLKTAGVVQGERRGREVVYRLVDDHLAHIVVDAVTHVQEGK